MISFIVGQIKYHKWEHKLKQCGQNKLKSCQIFIWTKKAKKWAMLSTASWSQAQNVKHDVWVSGESRDVKQRKTVSRCQLGVGTEANQNLGHWQISVKAGLVKGRSPFGVVLVDVNLFWVFAQEGFNLRWLDVGLKKASELLLRGLVEIRAVSRGRQHERLHRQVGHGTQRLQHLVVLGGKLWFLVDKRLALPSIFKVVGAPLLGHRRGVDPVIAVAAPRRCRRWRVRQSWLRRGRWRWWARWQRWRRWWGGRCRRVNEGWFFWTTLRLFQQVMPRCVLRRFQHFKFLSLFFRKVFASKKMWCCRFYSQSETGSETKRGSHANEQNLS